MERFKKDDYIVCLITTPGSHCVKKNYCFKQRQDSQHISPYFDIKGSKDNGNGTLGYRNKEDWRYATQFEIDEYERFGLPFDVTTINNPENPTYEIY